MMMDRAEGLGVYWRDEVKALQTRTGWEDELKAIANPNITYPSYYTTSFHAYDEGNLGWLPAMEVDVAARAVHARIWLEDDPRGGINGDASLRESYHQVLKQTLPTAPKSIIDLGCGAGRSTVTLQETFPEAQLTGVDLSPYFVTVAQHMACQMSASEEPQIKWVHAPAEETGLPADTADLVSVCLVFHELPQSAAEAIIAEAYRLLKPGGHFAIMDMNPRCETFTKMPPYILTLIKSTEPYLDQYFALDIEAVFQVAGFARPTIVANSPRHRSIVGQKPIA